eukprot:Polyplicarium_translucidae@DN2026_c0_g1_i3.p1
MQWLSGGLMGRRADAEAPDISRVVSDAFHKLPAGHFARAPRLSLPAASDMPWWLQKSLDTLLEDSEHKDARHPHREVWDNLAKRAADSGERIADWGQKRYISFQKSKWILLLTRFQKLFGKSSVGNLVEVMEGGDGTYKALWSAIDRAERRVWLESYLMDNSKTAEVFKKKLCGAARRGCDVLVVLDWLGSFQMPRSWKSDLEASGAKVVLFNPPLPSSNAVGPFVFRNHRKILITDEIGFCGSMNITKDNASPALNGSAGYYDVLLRLDGPAVSHLGQVVADSVRESRAPLKLAEIPPPPRKHGGVFVQVLESNVRRNKRGIQRAMRDAILFASESVWVTSSYFIPPGALRRALLSALCSGKSDVMGDEPACRHELRHFLAVPGGHCKVHLLRDKHCHAKNTIVDGLWSSVGSFNWDRYSFRRNLEVTVSVFDPDVAATLKSLHEEKIENGLASEMTFADWRKRNKVQKFSDWAMYKLAALTGHEHFDGLGCANDEEARSKQLVAAKEYEDEIARNFRWTRHGMWDFL